MVIGTSPNHEISVQGERRHPMGVILEDYELLTLRAVSNRPTPR